MKELSKAQRRSEAYGRMEIESPGIQAGDHRRSTHGLLQRLKKLKELAPPRPPGLPYQARHGEVFIEAIDELPAGVKELSPTDGNYIVGHSETGHHHVVSAMDASFFADPDSDLCYLKVTEPFAELRHLRSFDSHPAINLKQGTYKINWHEELTPRGMERVQD